MADGDALGIGFRCALAPHRAPTQGAMPGATETWGASAIARAARRQRINVRARHLILCANYWHAP